MLTKAIEVTKYIRASAGRAGLSVQFEDTNQPRHDGNTIYLPRIIASTTEQQLKELMASVDHEVAHERFSSFELLQEKRLDPSSALMFVWNFLEDSRINAIEAREYLGFKLNWDGSASQIIQSILERSVKAMSPTAALTRSLLCWEAPITAHLFPAVESVTSRFAPDTKYIDVLNNYSDRLVSCQQILDKRLGTQSTYDLAYDILKDLGIKPPTEETAAKSKTGKESSDKAKGEKSESEPTDETSDETETGEGTEAENKDEEYKIITVKLDKDDLGKLSLTMPTTGRKMGKVGLNHEPVDLHSKDNWDMTDYEKFVVVNYPKNLGRKDYFAVTPRHFVTEYDSKVGDNLVSQENFAQQVRKLIQIRARVQTQYGTKKGKLDQSRLSRICFDAPGFNERVFKHRIENKTLDAAISILVDMSGSMGGSKAYYALASALLMNEVCTTLRIPVEILGFTDAGDGSWSSVPLMFIYKSFSDLNVTQDDLKTSFAKSSNFMSGNPDGENILWAYERLLKRKERKRVFVVMSDGEPAASKSSYGLEAFTKQVIREIEQAKKVDIYGLGLCSSSVKHYYSAHDVVNKPEEIPSKLLSLIEKKVIGNV